MDSHGYQAIIVPVGPETKATPGYSPHGFKPSLPAWQLQPLFILGVSLHKLVYLMGQDQSAYLKMNEPIDSCSTWTRSKSSFQDSQLSPSQFHNDSVTPAAVLQQHAPLSFRREGLGRQSPWKALALMPCSDDSPYAAESTETGRHIAHVNFAIKSQKQFTAKQAWRIHRFAKNKSSNLLGTRSHRQGFYLQ